MSCNRMLGLAVIVVIFTVLLATTSYAQAPPGAPPGAGPNWRPGQPAPGQPGQPGQQGRQQQMNAERMRQMWMMQQRGNATPAIAVADGYVFVVFGNTLYQFTVDGLNEVAKATLGPQMPQRVMRGGRGGRGARGAGGGGGAAAPGGQGGQGDQPKALPGLPAD